MKFHLITIVTDPHGLDEIHRSIQPELEWAFNSFHWHVLVNGEQGQPIDLERFRGHPRLLVSGYSTSVEISPGLLSIRNGMLGLLGRPDCVEAQHEWIYFLDAGNLLHPQLVAQVRKCEREMKHLMPEILVFRQVNHTGTVVNTEHWDRNQQVDFGQFVMKRVAVRNTGFDTNLTDPKEACYHFLKYVAKASGRCVRVGYPATYGS